MNDDPNQSQQPFSAQAQPTSGFTPVSNTTNSKRIRWNKLPRWLRILLGILILLIAVASGYSYIQSLVYDPAPDTVIPYYNAIEKQDYANAFQYLTPFLRDVTGGSIITEQMFAQQAQDIDKAKGKVSSYKITNTAVGGRNNSSGDEKTYTVSVTRNGTSYDVNVYVKRQESDVWKISGYDDI